jgi:DNA-binding NtrC family response regulator
MATVLLVDDIDVVRFTLRKFCERGGHEVTECASVEDAEQVLLRSRPDVVVTDLWIPGQDGLTLIVSLREKHPSIPIIAITGGAPRLSQATSLEEARSAGAHHVLMKPVGMETLLSYIDDVLLRKDTKSSQDNAKCRV